MWGRPPLTSASPGRFQASLGALGDQFALELGECGENAEDKLALSRGRIDRRALTCQHFQPDTAGGEVVDDVDQVA